MRWPLEFPFNDQNLPLARGFVKYNIAGRFGGYGYGYGYGHRGIGCFGTILIIILILVLLHRI